VAAAGTWPGILAECLLAWADGEEGEDAKAAAFVVAETILLVRSALKPK